MLTACDSLDTTRVRFLPVNAVNSLIHNESVRKYCEGLSDPGLQEQCPDVIKYVCGHPEARFVFIIIVLINEPQLLHGLIRDKVFDSDVPLCRIPEVEGVDFQLAKRSDPKTPVNCFTNWTAAQRLSFDELQRQVKAAVLEKWPIDFPPYKLPDRSVLPFTECEIIHKESSSVYHVEIHHAHHNFYNGPNV